MTNEEIERHTETLALLLTDSHTSEGQRRARNLLRSVVSQAYGEAIKAQCWFCQNGYALDAEELTHQVEQVAGEGIYNTVTCPASQIHALKDSLALEPVLTS